MNGDLSLTDVHGGLRIANPDENISPLSPSTTTSPVNEQRRSSVAGYVNEEVADSRPQRIAPQYIPRDVARPLSPSAERFTYSTRDSSSRGASPLGSPYFTTAASNAPNEYENIRRGSTRERRPFSAIYNHPNNSGSSEMIYPGSYRYDRDLSVERQQPGLSRSASRSASHPLERPNTSRRVSQMDQYRQGQIINQNRSKVNDIPVRRSSSRMKDGISGSNTQQTMNGAYNSGLESVIPSSSEEWKEKGAAVITRQETDANGNIVQRTTKKGVKDFHFGRTLGEGSYSTVLAATDKQTGKEYAIKVLDKKHIIKEKKVKYVNIEKDTLNRLTDHPGIVRLYYTFQDERSLYFVLDLATGGELLGVLKKTGTFDKECSRYYAAQILDSIAYMHSRGIIHRDLKPENVLLDRDMHTKITDFGTAKILNLSLDNKTEESSGNVMDGADIDRATSFVGTAEYVSPELLTDKNACKASDLWAFGCILYQLMAGRPPFKAANEYLTFQKIVALEYKIPDGFPEDAKDLVQRLLVLDPADRLPIDQIRSHAFFSDIKWGRGLWRTKAPKLQPYVAPSQPPINLNNSTASTNTQPATGSTFSPVILPSVTTVVRPNLRSVTELSPPSQLDIDWASILTRPNERILKMGNLLVTGTSASQNPAQTPTTNDNTNVFSRLFGGGSNKRKERLVMITSTARLIVVAVGGEDKKIKQEFSLIGHGISCKDYQDSRGLTAFCIETVRVFYELFRLYSTDN